MNRRKGIIGFLVAAAGLLKAQSVTFPADTPSPFLLAIDLSNSAGFQLVYQGEKIVITPAEIMEAFRVKSNTRN